MASTMAGKTIIGRRFVLQGALGLTCVSAGADRSWAKPPGSPPKPITASFPNRAPLAPSAFVALPLGSVRASGWLLTQLELQRDGLTGHAEELLPYIGADNAWRGGSGDDWEKGPYYVKGLIPLAYTLDDANLKARAQVWVEAILARQQANGYIGPTTSNDWWPRILVTYFMRDYAEATGDARVVPFLTNYFRYMTGAIGGRPLQDWGRARAGDEIDTVLWLYNRTGDAFLLPLADTLAQQAYPWQQIQTNNSFMEFGNDYQPKHAVNVAQALKMPAIYSQRSNSQADRTAYATGLTHLMRDHGLACGCHSGSEALAGPSTTQAVELCAIVERMLSDETALRILGEPLLGDTLEQVAFNALPAATTRTMRQHVYYTLPNNVTAPPGGTGFNQDYSDGRTPGPHSGFLCCCYNWHMGWPKLTQNSWAATPDGGLAVLVYVPSQVSASVADGTVVTWTEDTDYPFGETIRFTLTTPKPVSFPFVLRIPAWCRQPTLSVNGQPANVAVTPGTFVTLSQKWKRGDEVVLSLPMAVQVASGVSNTSVVQRGPVVYSLPIAENWSVLTTGQISGFDYLDVTANSVWNYALTIDPSKPASSFAVVQRPATGNPFDLASNPIQLQVGATRLPSWTLARNGLVAFDPPVSPVAVPNASVETITLVPFGTQMLRVTNFPVIGTPQPPAAMFRDSFAQGNFLGWVPYGGGWFVNGGALHAASNPGTGVAGVKAVAAAAQFANFTYDATVSVGGQGDAGLLFRLTNPGIGPNSFNGYYVGISAEHGQVVLGKANGDWTQLASAPMGITADTPYHLRVQANGAHLQVFVEGMQTPLLVVDDTDYATGSIGVRHYNTDSSRTDAAFSGIVVVAA